MVQVKVYGTRTVWEMKREDISDAIHRAVVGAWGCPRTSGSTASSSWRTATWSRRSAATRTS